MEPSLTMLVSGTFGSSFSLKLCHRFSLCRVPEGHLVRDPYLWF